MIKPFTCSQKINATDVVELQIDNNCQNIMIIFQQESQVDFVQNWFAHCISDGHHSKSSFQMVTVQTVIIWIVLTAKIISNSALFLGELCDKLLFKVSQCP